MGVSLLHLLTFLPLNVLAQETREIFIYSPNERGGLHVACYDGGQWNEMGQVCSSDYGQWGAEKRMYHPTVCRAQDGTWRLVFQLNDRTPAFGAAYSRDLITWRPQDYPQVSLRALTGSLTSITRPQADRNAICRPRTISADLARTRKAR